MAKQITTRSKCLPCKHPRMLPLAIFKWSYKLIYILPDNQFIHIIIEPYYEAEVGSFKVTSDILTKRKIKYGLDEPDMFLNFLKKWRSLGINWSTTKNMAVTHHNVGPYIVIKIVNTSFLLQFWFSSHPIKLYYKHKEPNCWCFYINQLSSLIILLSTVQTLKFRLLWLYLA